MTDKEKQELIDEALTSIRATCAKVLQRVTLAEHFEDAADIRDARRRLESTIEDAVNNLSHG